MRPYPAVLKCLLTSLEQVEEGGTSVPSPAMTLSSATDSTDKVPVVKAKATHVIMNSLITSKRSATLRAEQGREEGVGSCRRTALRLC